MYRTWIKYQEPFQNRVKANIEVVQTQPNSRMGACDYYETYGVAPKSYLVFTNDLLFNDEEAALYLSLYKELPP